MSDVVERIEKMTPGPGDVVALYLTADAEGEDLGPLAEQLGTIASRTGATVLLLPPEVRLDQIDEREMLARGWLRVGPLAHTTEQLSRRTAP